MDTTEIIEFTRMQGVHNQATPETEEERTALANRLVDACRTVYRDGQGNTSDTIVRVLEMAGEIGDQTTAGQAPATPPAASNGGTTAEPPAEAAPVGPEEGPQGQAQVGEEAGTGAAGDPGGQELSEPIQPPESDAPAEPAAEAPQPSQEGQAAPPEQVEPAGEAPGAVVPHGATPSGAREKALERIAATRLPVPTDIMGGHSPDPLPRDVTSISDVELRKLQWQRHSLRSYTRWLFANVDTEADDIKRIMDARIADRAKELGQFTEHEKTSPTQLKALAKAEPEIRAMDDRHAELAAEAELLKSLLEWFSDDCAILSREGSMRKDERGGVAPMGGGKT